MGSVHEEAKPHLKNFWRDNIRTTGFTRDPENYLNQGTIYVFPSQWEGSAKTVYEAAACGLPCVTTKEAGDVIRDGIEGILVKPGDVDAIANAIRYFYDHPEAVEKMGAAARQRVVGEFHLGPLSEPASRGLQHRDGKGRRSDRRFGTTGRSSLHSTISAFRTSLVMRNIAL